MSTEMDGSLRYATPIVLRELRQLREKNANLRQRVAWLSELGINDALDAAYAEGHTKGEAAERERCARIAKDYERYGGRIAHTAECIAAAICAGGNK